MPTPGEPFKMLDLRRDIERVFDRYSQSVPMDLTATGTWLPPVDVVEREDVIIVTVELPGTRREDIEVAVSEGVITIQAQKKHDHELSKEVHHRSERFFGNVSRSLTLPARVDKDRIAASYLYGVLTITLPKMEPSKPTSIEITGR